MIEATTREAYTYQLNKHIMPWFGPMRMNEIMPSHVREWVTDLQAKGVTPATIQKVRFILSAIFTDRAERRDLPAPVQGREDSHRPAEAPQDHHAGAVRRDLRGNSRRHSAAAGRDRHRKRPAVGRTDRAARKRP